MLRRDFVRTGLAVGALLLTRPGSAVAGRVGAARLVVRVDRQLGLHGVALAESYLAALARALRRPVVAHPDGMRVNPLRAVTDTVIEPEGEPELLLTAQWSLGPALRSQPQMAAVADAMAPLGVIEEVPLSVETSRGMPARWHPLLDVLAPRTPASSSGAVGFSLRDPLAAQLAGTIFSVDSSVRLPTLVGFRSEQALRPALIGNQLAAAILPLRPWPDGGVPGDFANPVEAHRRGELRIAATAGRVRHIGLPDVPTLDEVMGEAGYDAHWQTQVHANPHMTGSLMQSIEAATTHFRRTRSAA